MKKTIVFCCLLSLFIACKKDKDNSGNTCNQDMAGISGTYKVTAVTYKVNATSAEQDFYNQLYPNACERDDLYILNANGTYILKDSGVQCGAGDQPGNWSVNGNLGNIDGNSVTIQSFNCSSLVIVWPDFFVFGDQLKLTFTRQ